ncbi:hypothetical protein BDV93DRAFT_528263 [Ceratobasidium sp. AG-I]|nr:hypothetical protein BDV93DRAFT_528263 [Ceratobasidium sp. AG-I]
MDALRKWEAAKAHLKEALDLYLKACLDLKSVVLHPVSNASVTPNPRHGASLDINILDVCAEIRSAGSIQSVLSESHAHIFKILNTSTSHVPIAALPAEVLTHIFSLTMLPSACAFPYPRILDMMHTLTSVCTWWRHLATSTSTLWSHIDVGLLPGMQGQEGWLTYLQLRLERAGTVPLHLHAQRLQYLPPESLTKMAQILEPYLDSLASLDMSIDGCTSHISEYLTQRFAKSCILGSSKSFALDAPMPYRRPAAFWSPLKSMKGLIRLELSGLPSHTISTFGRLVRVVSKHPFLRSLRLNDLDVSPPDQTRCRGPIALPHLESLDLLGMDSGLVTHLLSTLVVEKPGLRLRVDLSDDDDEISATLQFLKRSKVKALYGVTCYAPCHKWIIKCSPFLQQLQMLFLDLGNDSNNAAYTALVSHDSTPRFQSLEVVHLARMEPKKSCFPQLRDLLSVYRLRKLLFLNCDMTLCRATEAKVVQNLSALADEVRFLDVARESLGDYWDTFIQASITNGLSTL